MKAFHHERYIKHNPSSPHFPRSNGQVERSVQTLKNSLRKALADGQDLHAVLIGYRSTPTDGLASPAELLMGRKLKTKIPILKSLLKPQNVHKDVVKTIQQRQQRQHQNDGK